MHDGIDVLNRLLSSFDDPAQLLDQEMATMGLHALSLNTKAPSEASQERS
jgi:hypothetical protein